MNANRFPKGNVLVILIPIFFLQIQCGGSHLITLSGATMGTTYTVKYVSSSSDFHEDDFIETLKNAIQNRLDEINQKMSTYIPDSEISRFNQYDQSAPFALSGETFDVIQAAQYISQETGGAFDITVGPFVNAYGFGPDFQKEEMPSEETIDALRDKVGYTKLQLDEKGHTILKQHPGIYCDLSALAKGYGVDQISELLQSYNLQDFMVEIGGEIRVQGRNQHGHYWAIAIERPVPTERRIYRILHLRNQSIATSGDYRNYLVQEGSLISHTIDPRNGKPVHHRLTSVSVIHEECMIADAYATAIMVLGMDSGFQLAERKKLAVLFLVRNEDGTITEKASTEFQRFVD